MNPDGPRDREHGKAQRERREEAPKSAILAQLKPRPGRFDVVHLKGEGFASHGIWMADAPAGERDLGIERQVVFSDPAVVEHAFARAREFFQHRLDLGSITGRAPLRVEDQCLSKIEGDAPRLIEEVGIQGPVGDELAMPAFISTSACASRPDAACSAWAMCCPLRGLRRPRSMSPATRCRALRSGLRWPALTTGRCPPVSPTARG